MVVYFNATYYSARHSQQFIWRARMRRTATALRWLGHAWLYLAGAFIGLNYIAIIYFHGWSKYQEIANPYNLINFVAVMLTLLPGIGLIQFSEYLQRRAAASRSIRGD